MLICALGIKIGSGGAATTSYNMARKGSNANISELTNPEESSSQREIFNLLYSLLSISIQGEPGNQTEEVLECKAVLTDKEVQVQLGKLGSIYLAKFSISNLDSEFGYSNMKKYKIIEILEKIVRLLGKH